MIDLPTWAEFQQYIIDQIQTNEFFAAAGFFSLLGVIWQYTKKFPESAWTRIRRKILYTANIEETDEFYSYFENWLNKNHKCSYRNIQVTTTANKTYNSYSKTYSYKEEEEGEEPEFLKFKQFQDIFYIRRGLVIIKIFKGREKLENASNINNAYYNHFKISALFGKRVINKMLQEVLDLKAEEDKLKKGKQIGVWTNSGSHWQKEEDFEPKSVDSIILPEKEQVIEDIQDFLDSRQWYKRRSIPYKRGYMFFGAPGSGKTSFSLSLAKHFIKDMYVLNPSGVKDDELRSLFRYLNKNSILLIEDIDAVFNKERDKKENDVKFNFSTLLNCLDGVFSKEGIITIFTTNYPDSLDSALIREGRIDFKLEISNPTNESIKKYLELFYEQEIDVEFAEENDSISMAKIQEICLVNKTFPEGALSQINILLKSQENETVRHLQATN